LADPQALITLPEAELRNGMAEVVKHGVIGDGILFSLVSQGWDAALSCMDRIVPCAMSVKVRVIEADPFERGERATLNLGHTLGHALELASAYQLRHGEAVAIGMIAAARLAEKLHIANRGVTDQIKATLFSLGLPTGIPRDLEAQRILQAMAFDKKKSDGLVRFVLPVRIGEVRWGIAVNDIVNLISEMQVM